MMNDSIKEIPNRGVCDICGFRRAQGNHAKCSRVRQKNNKHKHIKKINGASYVNS